MRIADNEILEALGLRAMACRHWRWMPGMLVQYVGPPNDLHPKGLRLETRVRRVNWIAADGDLPDLSDPGTLGCLIALVREAYAAPHLFCTYRLEGVWSVCDLHEHRSTFVHTEAEAWIEALEGAP